MADSVRVRPAFSLMAVAGARATEAKVEVGRSQVEGLMVRRSTRWTLGVGEEAAGLLLVQAGERCVWWFLGGCSWTEMY